MKNPFTKYRLRILLLCLCLLVLLASFILIWQVEKQHALKLDLSYNRITSFSAASQQMLKKVKVPVHIYAFFPKGQEDRQFITLLERMAGQTPHVTFSVEDVTQNPVLVHQLSDQQGNAVQNDSVVVKNMQSGRIRILQAPDFIETTYQPETGAFALTGATYEQSIMQAIEHVLREDMPKAYILTGHGEYAAESRGVLDDLLKKQNFDLETIDLHRQVPEKQGVLLILSPEIDLTDDELTKLTDYANQGNALFITTAYQHTKPMPNFDSLLRMFGVQRLPGVIVANESDAGAFFQNPLYLMPYMQESEITSALKRNGQDRLILAGATGFDMLQESNRDLQIFPLLISGEAYLRPYENQNTTLLRQKGDRTGTFPLAIYANRAHTDGNHAKAFMIGNAELFTSDWMLQNTYSREFLHAVLQALSPSPLSDLNIVPKQAVRPPLIVPRLWIAVLILLLPAALVTLAGVTTLSKRNQKPCSPSIKNR